MIRKIRNIFNKIKRDFFNLTYEEKLKNSRFNAILYMLMFVGFSLIVFYGSDSFELKTVTVLILMMFFAIAGLIFVETIKIRKMIDERLN